MYFGKVKKTLISWIGKTDLRAIDEEQVGLGPIGQAVKNRNFDRIILLNNYSLPEAERFKKWLAGFTKAQIEVEKIDLSSPTEYVEIYGAVKRTINRLINEKGTQSKFVFHLSPGTPAMTAIWILLAKTQFPAELIESSREKGVKTVNFPFEVSAEFIPDLLKQSDDELQRLTIAAPPEAPEFVEIIHRSEQMKRLINLARRVAIRNVSIIIEGESGTGKELLARAIHKASSRADKPFVTVNCGAIPAELVESELFGHKKGAFTGATVDRIGYFESANGGTIFLDEIGELPLKAQVKLLRVLQESEVIRVGSSSATKINVRVISATNRSLLSEIQRGNFREDLFYRLAVFVLQIPPLREREGDVGLLVDNLWRKLNVENAKELNIEPKTLSPAARNLLLNHHWSGNVRELQNTLTRILVCCDDDVVSGEDVKGAFFQVSEASGEVLNRELDNDFSLEKLLAEVSSHYIERARNQSATKKGAAKLLGFSSHQTLDNWVKKHNLE